MKPSHRERPAREKEQDEIRWNGGFPNFLKTFPARSNFCCCYVPRDFPGIGMCKKVGRRVGGYF